MVRVLGVIPARFGAERFPGKLLEDLHGRSVLEWVYRRAKNLEGLDRLYIATDDDRIESAAIEFGANVIRTRPDHNSGTERIGEVVRLLSENEGYRADIVLNLQGDEPLLPVMAVADLIEAMKNATSETAREAGEAESGAGLAARAGGESRDRTSADDRKGAGAAVFTLVHPIESEEEFHRPSVVKVVRGGDRALYFSRAPVPFPRTKTSGLSRWRHVGIYGYPTPTLQRWLALPSSDLEKCEGLEQLRALEAGIEFRVIESDATSPGIDIPEDLEHLRREMTREQMERGVR